MRSAAELARIRKLAIPPAWTDVWICPDANGHLQATGRDARGRRQYRYHPRFRARRDENKFARLVEFGTRLPRIRRRVRRDLASRGLARDKVLAAVIRLLDVTFLRVGNDEYARVNRSFGVSTLRDRHAQVAGSTLRLRFRGKGGRTEERAVVDRRLASVVRRCQELPGQELFQYVDEDDEVRGISSEDVNAYLREAAGSEDLSAKDFRTWTATVLAFRALEAVGADVEPDPDVPGEAASRRRRRDPILEALRKTATQLGDTLAVTRSSYVHPAVIDAFDRSGEDDLDPASTTRRRRRDGPPTRAEELAVLALLRRGARAARRSQARTPEPSSRARRRRA